jgi:hypothetical protein
MRSGLVRTCNEAINQLVTIRRDDQHGLYLSQLRS